MKIILFLFTAVICMSACDKEAKRFPFQPDTANYFLYKNNTKWIYEHKTNGFLDTVVCTESLTGFTDRSEGVAEVSSVNLEGKLDKKVIIRAEAIPNQNVDRIAMVTLVKGILQLGPILLNVNGTFNAEDSAVATKLLTFESNSKQYTNIWEITLKSHPVYKKIWFNANQGIIKKIYLNSDTFNLINFIPGQ